MEIPVGRALWALVYAERVLHSVFDINFTSMEVFKKMFLLKQVLKNMP